MGRADCITDRTEHSGRAKGKSIMSYILQKNVEAVIRQEDETSLEGIEDKLLELQKELLKLANSKKDYNSVADEIDRLRELKQNALVESAEREGLKQLSGRCGSFWNSSPQRSRSMMSCWCGG